MEISIKNKIKLQLTLSIIIQIIYMYRISYELKTAFFYFKFVIEILKNVVVLNAFLFLILIFLVILSCNRIFILEDLFMCSICSLRIKDCYSV